MNSMHTYTYTLHPITLEICTHFLSEFHKYHH